MKKAKLLFSILLVCTLVLVGCGKKDKKEDKKKEKPAPATAGESLDIKLESNSSTGYSWTYELEGDDETIIYKGNSVELDKYIFDAISASVPTSPKAPGATLPSGGKDYRVLTVDELIKEKEEKGDSRFDALNDLEFDD